LLVYLFSCNTFYSPTKAKKYSRLEVVNCLRSWRSGKRLRGFFRFCSKFSYLSAPFPHIAHGVILSWSWGIIISWGISLITSQGVFWVAEFKYDIYFAIKSFVNNDSSISTIRPYPPICP
jgi:hypothetical protein